MLAGKTGPVRDIVMLNAAAAALAYAGPKPGVGVADQLAPHFARAAEVIDSGAAASVLDTWVAATQRLAADALYLPLREQREIQVVGEHHAFARSVSCSAPRKPIVRPSSRVGMVTTLSTEITAA